GRRQAQPDRPRLPAARADHPPGAVRPGGLRGAGRRPDPLGALRRAGGSRRPDPRGGLGADLDARGHRRRGEAAALRPDVHQLQLRSIHRVMEPTYWAAPWPAMQAAKALWNRLKPPAPSASSTGTVSETPGAATQARALATTRGASGAGPRISPSSSAWRAWPARRRRGATADSGLRTAPVREQGASSAVSRQKLSAGPQKPRLALGAGATAWAAA